MAGLDELKSDESSLMIYYRCPTPLFVSLNKRGWKLHGALKNLEIPPIMVQTLGACDEWVGGRFCSQTPDTFSCLTHSELPYSGCVALGRLAR